MDLGLIGEIYCGFCLALSIIFPIAYLSLEFRTSLSMDVYALLLAGVTFFLPMFAMQAGANLRIETRKRGKETEERTRTSTIRWQDRHRKEIEEYVQLQEAWKKWRSAPETLTKSERSAVQQTASDAEAMSGIAKIAAIGGLAIWDEKAPLKRTQEEYVRIPGITRFSFVCPNCREFSTFEHDKSTKPVYKTPESMHRVGNRLFTTTTVDCPKCSKAIVTTLLQCEKCKTGWQPIFKAVHTRTILTGVCSECFFGKSKS